MTVYLIVFHNRESTEIVAVLSSDVEAGRWMVELPTRDDNDYYYFSTIPMEVDSRRNPPKWVKTWWVKVDWRGNVVGTDRQWVPVEEVEELKWNRPYYAGGTINTLRSPYEYPAFAGRSACSMEDAVRSVQEFRSKWLSENGWDADALPVVPKE